MPRLMPRAIALAPALFLLAPVIAYAAWPHDPTVNVPVSVGPNSHQGAVAVSDGSGGMYIAWQDDRSGTYRIYAQHIAPDGTIFPGWAPNGNEVKTTFTSRTLDSPAICSDDAGGAVIAWREAFSQTDHDIYAQRLSPTGIQIWGAGGIAVAASGVDQFAPRGVDDGAGNIDILWGEDHTGGGTGLDLYANRLSPAGNIRWGVNGVIVCNATGDQYSGAIVGDGVSGFDAAWVDRRTNSAIFATRFDSTGTLHSGWTANGISVASGNYYFSAPLIVGNSGGGLLVAWTDDRNGLNTSDLFATAFNGNSFELGVIGGATICSANGYQTSLALCPDGADGAFVTWDDARSDHDVYAAHLSSSGFLASGWPANGLAVATGNTTQSPTAIIADGVGGCIIAMIDNAGIRNDVYATHLMPSGAIAEGWTAETPICTALADQINAVLVSDGASGAILAWLDQRNNLSYDLYAQNVDKWGKLGVASPNIVSVKDIPNDQGGRVRVSWNASYLDAYPNYLIGSYWLWRQVPTSIAEAALRSGHARLLAAGEAPDGTRGRVLRVTTDALQTNYWEFVTSQIANAFPNYSLDTATPGDSTGTTNPQTLFMIEARGSGHQSWDSVPLGGYSVDNLPPAAPAPFTGAYASGTTYLHWGENSEPDLAGYRLYRGNSAGFVPGPGNLVSAQPDTGYNDSGAAGSYYKLSAVDVHGNESLFAILGPSGTTGVSGAVPGATFFERPVPNPAASVTTLRYGLPRETRVDLAIYDATGRRVRALLSVVEPAGEYAAKWDLRDDAGHPVGAGLYFVRLSAEGRTLSRRMVTLR